MNIIKGGVTKPQGFKANGLCCGIKRSGKPDLGLIFSEKEAVTVGVFTRNSIKAAPLKVSQRHLRDNKARAIIVNSGNANCLTACGIDYAERTAKLIAEKLNIGVTDVVVASTGIIGKPLPYKKIENSASRLVEGLRTRNADEFARSILTTDTRTKQVCVRLSVGGTHVTIGACAKGSGMIAPDMATMLAFITTDVAITAKMLKLALKKATERSFNCISIDGCMSTNDMVVVMANGLASNRLIGCEGQDFDSFCKGLEFVCLELAKKIVLDGEGATKFIEINVNGAKTSTQAKKIAMAVANSSLVKTAAYGSNPNWGRVAAAVGSLGISNITEETMKINFSPFSRKNITISIALSLGDGEATVYTSDLSKEYIEINGRYN